MHGWYTQSCVARGLANSVVKVEHLLVNNQKQDRMTSFSVHNKNSVHSCFTGSTSSGSLVPRPLPDFILQLWRETIGQTQLHVSMSIYHTHSRQNYNLYIRGTEVDAQGLQCQALGIDFYIYLSISVMTPVPTVLLPSLRVNLWFTSRGISFLRVSVRGVSSPGITISLSVTQEEGGKNRHERLMFPLYIACAQATPNAVEGLVKLLHRMMSGGCLEAWLIALCTTVHQKCHTSKHVHRMSFYIGVLQGLPLC